MSGVMALLQLDGRPLDGALARALLGAVAHRGDRPPRLWCGAGIALGHANLPTTPEAEREDLPAADPTGRYHITWDGRLDNRDELAHALDLDPAAARIMTDASYVLAAYARWGDACVGRLVGDWALVIWDSVARRLFAAADPLGWRPLYYTRAGGTLALGSEPQQLSGGRLPRRSVNREYLLRYVADAMQEPGETAYAGMRRLEGGQQLVAGPDRVRVRAFWSTPRVRERNYRGPEDCLDEFAAAFRLATRARLRANRPIGVSLSGGLDSSYVAAIAAREGASLTALTVYARDTRLLDERDYSRAVAHHLGIARVEVDISDCWALSRRWLPDDVFDDTEHPAAGASFVRLARATHDAGIGVVLGGEGGDEWMTAGSGYIADAALHGRPAAAWRLARLARGRRSTASALTRALYRDTMPFAVQDRVARWRGRPGRPETLPFATAEPAWTSVARFERALAWQQRRQFDVAWRLYRQISVPHALWRERNALTPHGVEIRTPFNDLRVIEAMAAIPEWLKQVHGRPKDLLREAARDHLPRMIVDRTDKGLYTELVDAGAGVHERARVQRAVDTIASYPGVNGAAARREVDHWVARQHRWWRPAWRLITAGLWLQQLDVPRSVAEHCANQAIPPVREEVMTW